MNNEEKEIKKGCLVGIIVLIIVVFLFGSFRTISSGQVGVKTRFGKVVGSQLNEGINLKLPLIEKIVKINIRVQKTEVNTSSASKDLQNVSTKIAVNYRVNSDKATDLFKNVGTKYEETILQPAIRESVKVVTSQYTAEELITHRADVSAKCIKTLQNKVEKYGLSIDNFNIMNFSFSGDFNKAIEEKQIAEQKVLTAKQELEKEKIDAEKKVVKAKAEKEANEMKQQSLTDNIIKEKFIDKWNGELPKATGSNAILNIDSLLK